MGADNIRWNLWRLNAKGQRVQWMGSVTDESTGFAWLRKQGAKAKQYVINNVPPESGRTQNPTRVQQLHDGSVVQTGEVLMPRDIPGKTDVPKRKRVDIDPAKPVASVPKFDWDEYEAKTAHMRPTQRAESAVLGSKKTARKPAPKKAPAKKVEVDPAMAKAAKARHDVLKADEAKDIAKAKENA